MPEIPCPLALGAAECSDTLAFVASGVAHTYAELNVLVSRVAKNLRACGVRKGDRVALFLPRSMEYPSFLLGIIRIGAMACPLNPQLPLAAVRSALHRIACATIVAGAEPRAMLDSAGLRVLAAHTLLEPCPASVPRIERITTERPAVVVFTSGSADEPKAAVLTYGNLLANAAASNVNLPLQTGDRWLLSLPMYHVSGLGVLFRCLQAKATVVIPEPGADLAERIQSQAVTHVSLVATQLYRMLHDRRQTLAGLKAILLGGSALPASLLADALDCCLPVYISYGLTEMASQVATAPLATLALGKRPSANVLIPGSLRIGADSEIEVRGPTLFAGYLRGESLERPLTKDGWFRTGDLGRLDDSGRLTVLGRKDNMFVSGGENIQPEEIEAHLGRIPGIMQAVVVPVADPEYGQRPAAFIEMAPGYELDPPRWSDELAQSVPRFKLPVAFLRWPQDTGSPGLKVSRQHLAQLAADRLS